MRTSQTVTITGAETARVLAERFVDMMATLGEDPDLFTEDVLFDVNVPQWRFQVSGPRAFIAWLKEHTSDGYDLTVRQIVPAASGVLIELSGTYTPHGHKLYFRNLIHCTFRDRRISEVVYYCTGDWEPETVARHAAAVTLVRS